MHVANDLVTRVSFRDTGHQYFLDGKRIPSVTTILGNLSKPGLPQWAANVGADAARDVLMKRAAVMRTQTDDGEFREGSMLLAPGLEDLARDVHDAARTAHHRVKTKAADKGSVVHDAIQQYHEDFFTAEPPPEVDDEGRTTDARRAWQAFMAWWSTSDLTCISTERKIVDPDGRYAGRIDMLCEDEAGDLFVCDVKTSNGIYAEHVYQNAAYAHAISAELERPVAGTLVIWLPAGCDKATIVERAQGEWLGDWHVFESLLDVHAHRRGLSAWLMDIKREHGPIPF